MSSYIAPIDTDNLLSEAEKEIKRGKCVTLPPAKKGGLKLVIPDSVSNQLMDIVNKHKK